ncbi:VOC family protein [Kitasatospora sp. NPDC094015]|uniref:VOC family protein n=1 Tax=Kitasatospora sp. NPDC094015 TaxID=3155205 RepID=UPI00331D06E3
MSTTARPTTTGPAVLLHSRDPEASAAFYTALLGWRFVRATEGRPDRFRHGGRTVATVLRAAGPSAVPAWTPAFACGDLRAASRRILAAGGRPPAGPFRSAGTATDPTGASFTLRPGSPSADGPGSVYWTELFSLDPAAAKAFYRTALGWRSEDIPFEGGRYTVMASAHCGIRQLHPREAAAGTTSHWLPYLAVEDVDRSTDRAGRLGATLLAPVREIPGFGRSARFRDPHGAVFALVSGNAKSPSG